MWNRRRIGTVNTRLYLNSALALILTAPLLPAISLEEAVALAQAQNRKIRLSAECIGQREAELAAEKTRRYPVSNVMATAGIGVTRADVTFPRGAFGVYDSVGPIPDNDRKLGIPRRLTGFSYSQVALPLTQQVRIGAAIGNAADELAVSRLERARTEQEVTAQVRQLYFALLGADAARKAAEANLALAKEVERLVAQGVEAGTTLAADQGEAGARRQRAEVAVSGVEAERANLQEQFNLLLGRRLDEAVEVTLPAEAANARTLAEVKEMAVAERPEVESARLRMHQAELAVRAKKWEQIPDVSLVFQHFGFLNTGNLAPTNYAVAGLQVNWEPWDWGRKKKEARALAYQVKAARIAREETADAVRAQASQALRAFEQSQKEVAAAEAAVAAARESVRVNRERYEQQAALLRALLEAQTSFEAAQEQQVRAMASRGTAWANLQLAMGQK